MKDFFQNEAIINETQRAAINAAKGFLIVSIIIGHFKYITGPSYLYSFVYGYHVIGFLLLAFIYPVAALNRETFLKYLTRYGWPFLIFFLLFGVLNFLFLGGQDSFSILGLAEGLIFQTPDKLDQAVGTSILWFLPALFATVALLSLLIGKKPFSLLWLIMIALLLHGTAGFIPREAAQSIPLSLVNVVYIFFIGLVFRAVMLWVKDKVPPESSVWAALMLFILLQAIIVPIGQDVDISGFHLSDFSEPLILLLTGLIPISIMIFLCANSWLRRSRILVWIGDHSLALYLFHQPVMIAIWKLYLHFFTAPPQGNFSLWLVAGVVFLLTVLFSSLIAYLIDRNNFLRIILFPRDHRELKTVFERR